jgi:glutaconate CoA-transferase subunit A
MQWTGLSPDDARENLEQKDKSKRDKRMSLTEAVTEFVKDGDHIGVGGFVNSRPPVAIAHEIIRQGRQDLSLAFQSAGLVPDYLMGAMALRPDHLSISRLEFAYVGHEYAGTSSMLRYMTENNKIVIEDWTNYNMSARFKAGSMGLPFLPTRSGLGGDIEKCNRSQFIKCPFTDRDILLVPACHPDVGIIHVQEADIYGNCRIKGQTFTCPEMAMASKNVIVTCEKLVEHDIIATEPTRTSIPYFAVDAVVELPFGSFPGLCHDIHYYDKIHLEYYKGLTNGFRKGVVEPLREYFDKYVFGVKDIDGFISLIPYEQLKYAQQVESRSLHLQQGLQDPGA